MDFTNRSFCFKMDFLLRRFKLSYTKQFKNGYLSLILTIINFKQSLL